MCDKTQERCIYCFDLVDAKANTVELKRIGGSVIICTPCLSTSIYKPDRKLAEERLTRTGQEGTITP